MKSKTDSARVGLYRLVRLLSAKVFRLPHWTIIPSVAVGHECACWGYPSCWWVSFEWVAWSVQFALYSRPCEHCFFYKPNTKTTDAEATP